MLTACMLPLHIDVMGSFCNGSRYICLPHYMCASAFQSTLYANLDSMGGCSLDCLFSKADWLNIYVTGSEKTAHFAQNFKIELLVLQDRVALKQ